jgi:hypothetical protein
MVNFLQGVEPGHLMGQWLINALTACFPRKFDDNLDPTEFVEDMASFLLLSQNRPSKENLS